MSRTTYKILVTGTPGIWTEEDEIESYSAQAARRAYAEKIKALSMTVVAVPMRYWEPATIEQESKPVYRELPVIEGQLTVDEEEAVA